jgi:hypothetical protein
MELHLKIVGVILIVLSLAHVSFPRYFNWTAELSTLSLINRQMMYIHTFFIALVVFLIGLLCLVASVELMKTTLGNKVALGFGVFWTIRLVIQFFGYSPKLWKGKGFETTIHILFSILWFYLSAVFLLIFWASKPLS